MSEGMDAELKAKWIAALRSGDYQQARGSLRSGDGYCCLGVLCDIVDPTAWREDYGKWSWGTSYSIISDPQASEMGLGDETMLGPFSYGSIQNRLSMYNDAGESFEQIANRIEEGL